MKDLKKIFIATSNKGKIKELEILFAKLGIETIYDAECKINPPEETETTFLGNAILKAKYYSQFVPYPCFADDSGLCVKELNNQPGIHSARWGVNGDFEPAINKIKKMLNAKNLTSSKASYVCALALYHKGNLITAEGILNGMVKFSNNNNFTFTKQNQEFTRKTNGFGYDPIFIPEGYNQTLSDLSPEIKNQISHRVQAFDKIFKLDIS